MKTTAVAVSEAEDDIIRIWLKTGKLDRIIQSMRIEAAHKEAAALEKIPQAAFVKASIADLPITLESTSKNLLHDAFCLRIAIKELEKFLDETHPIYGFLQIDS